VENESNGTPGRLPVLLASLGVGALLIAGGVALRIQQDEMVLVAIASTQTALAPTLTPTNTATSTHTLTPSNTPTPSDTPTITPTPTDTPTGTLPPTDTPTPSLTPSPTPVPAVTVDTGTYATPSTPPATGIPTPVNRVAAPNGVINVLLTGSDRRPDDGGYRTDTMIIVSINMNEGTVNMLSIPRDLYVYIPGYTMARINVAASRGQAVGWRGGGPGLLKETLLYNFGITIHHYAHVEFQNFRDIIDILGGVEVPVDCALTDWRLKDTSIWMDDFETYEEWVAYTEDENNFEEYTLPVGVHRLNGYMALWYARSRRTTTDFDRSRRQQIVLRAILAEARSQGLINITRAPELWQEYSDLVETDMGLGNILDFIPVAYDLEPHEINSYRLTPDLMTSWTEPGTGANVYLPNPGAVERMVGFAMQPPSQNYLVNNTTTVEIRNGTGLARLDEVAASVMAWEGGYNPIPTGFASESPNQQRTVIYDYTGQPKGRSVLRMQYLLRVADADVIAQPDPNRTVDYVVVLGNNYQTCQVR
jgi:LCP family protein required for cell wall assembly